MKPAAAVALIEAPHAEPAVLLIRRSKRPGDPWAGHWAFPGGRRDPGDRDCLATALRELHEECGIELPRSACSEAFKPVFAGRHVGHPLLVAPFHFCLDAQPEATPCPREVAASLWCPLSQLRQYHDHERGPVNPHRPDQDYPYLPLDGHPLWGFTYGVLARWLGLAPPT
ncbi:MAG: CoA pyrophosphatase [Planctomycetota bacterium]|jgi:8-oxo-dGTP diphosphatase|nr:CoA pyrophosphatase [Planctomycetota bacterium]